MNNKIQCSVTECKYHDHNNKCTLDSIKVGRSKNNVDCKECTECESFCKE